MDGGSLENACRRRGKFLDAQGTWFVRFAPPVEPLGDAIVHFADEAPIGRLAEANETWPSSRDDYQFAGYRLDALGIPTMLYRFRDIEVEDRVAPTDATTLARSVKLRRDVAGITRVSFLAAVDKSLTRINDQTYANHAGLKTTLVNRTGGLRTSKLATGAERDEWIVSLEFEKETELELQYRW